ncbi:beta-galactosidase [Candidatus Sumerlaeota bacterium]|nr:beta-galactosidase [Candidatus Sumerlaeota bacterium]
MKTLNPSSVKTRGISLFIVILISAVSIGQSDSSSPPIDFKLDVPGNLFFEGDTIAIEMMLSDKNGVQPLSATALLLDDANSELRRKMFAIPDKSPRVIRDKIGELPPGYYSYIVELKYPGDDVSRHFIKLGVICKPQQVFTPQNAPFAVDAFLSWRAPSKEKIQKAAEIMKRIGVLWTRDRISWNQVQPEREKWDWSRYDDSQKIQNDAGISILQVFHDTAHWAAPAIPGKEQHITKFAPEDTRDCYLFTKTIASHFSKQVQAWELWNEFDIPVFFLGSADEYARVLKAGYLGVKNGNPQALSLFGSVTLVSGNLTWGNEVFSDKEGIRMVEKVFENGACEYFDVFNLHHYGPVYALPGKIRQCRKLMNRFGYDKPIWITEMGVTSTEKMNDLVDESERDQARYLVQAYCLALSEGVQRFFFFSLPSFIEHGVSFWGILEETPTSWQPKCGMIALSNLLVTLDGFHYMGRYKMPLPVEALVFAKGSKGRMVLWSVDGKTHKPSVFFKTRQKNLALRGMYGFQREKKKSLVCSLYIDKDPVFLMDFDVFQLDEHLLEKPSQKPVISSSPNLNVLKDLWIEIRTEQRDIQWNASSIQGEVRLYNLSAFPRTGTLSFSLAIPPHETKTLLTREIIVSTDKYSQIPFDFSLEHKEIAALFDQPDSEIRMEANLELKDSALEILPAVRYLVAEQPVEISRAELIDASQGNAALRFKIKNVAENDLSLSLSMKREGYNSFVTPPLPVNLAADETREVSFDLTPFFLPNDKPESNKVKILTEIDGMTFVRNTYIEANSIPRCSESPVIDGKFDDWRNYRPFTLEGRENFVTGWDLLDDMADFRGEISLAWDAKSLYIFARIMDRNVMNPLREETPWTGDALEIFLDMRKDSELGKPQYSPSVFQIFAVPPDAAYPRGLFKVWQPSKVQFLDVKMASQILEDYYCLEIAIPWKNLTQETPSLGMTFGCEFTLDDIDSGDYSHRQLVWRGGANNFRDPSLFSRVFLSDPQDKQP